MHISSDLFKISHGMHIKTQYWHDLATYIEPLTFMSAKTYFAGGIGCEGVDRGQSRHCLDTVEIYNPDGDYWRDGPRLPCAQLSLRGNAPNAGVVGGKIYVCGYYKGAGDERISISNE